MRLELEVDHHLGGEPFQLALQLRVGKLRRHGEERVHLEQRIGGHRRAHELGVEIFDADAAPREAAGEIAHDAGPVVADELQPDDPLRRWRGTRIAFGDDDDEIAGAQGAQRGGKRLELLVGYLEVDDARELAGEPRHAAARPVGAEALRHVGQPIDDPGAVLADHGQYERLRHTRSLASRISRHDSRFDRDKARRRERGETRSGRLLSFQRG